MTTSSAAGTRVLIVDDDHDLAESMRDLFEHAGYVAETVHSADEAIARFQSSAFDLCFMDIRLPGKNGIDALHEIRAHNPEARVVMMTGFSVDELIRKAQQNGALAVLHKPLDMGRVLDLMESLPPIAPREPETLAEQ